MTSKSLDLTEAIATHYLNKVAGRGARTSPQKAKILPPTPSNDASKATSPSGAASTTQLQRQPVLKRRSARLSAAPEPLKRKRDDFEVPEDDEQEPPKAAKAQRTLRRRPRDQLSELAADVEPNRNLSKRGKLDRHNAPPSTVKTRSATASERPVRGHPVTTPTEAKGPRSRGRPPKPSRPHQQEADRYDKPPNQQKDPGNETQDDKEDPTYEDVSEEDHQKEVIRSPSSHNQAGNNGKANVGRKRRVGRDLLSDEDIKEALGNFETLAKMFGNRSTWAKMLSAAKANCRRPEMIQTPVVKVLVKLIQGKGGLREYLTDNTDGEVDEDLIRRKLAVIEAKAWEIKQSTRPKPPDDDDPERDDDTNPATETDRQMITDIYLNAIPSLVFLLQHLAQTRHRDGKFSSEALKELIDTCEILHRVCFMAAGWSPRPRDFDIGVLRDTREAIGSGAKALQASFVVKKRALDAPKEREAAEARRKRNEEELAAKRTQEDVLRARVREDHRRQNPEFFASQPEPPSPAPLYRLKKPEHIDPNPRQTAYERQIWIRAELAEKRAREEADIARRRARRFDSTSQPAHAQNNSTEQHVFDLEADFNFDSGELEVNPSPSRRRLHDPPQTTHPEWQQQHHEQSYTRMSGALPAFPSPPTNSTTMPIPPPLPPPQSDSPWTRPQQTALLAGLETFTGSNRYERILDAYPDILAGRDIDDLVAEARRFREVVADDYVNRGVVWPLGEKGWLSSVR